MEDFAGLQPYDLYRQAVIDDVLAQMAEYGWSPDDAAVCVMSVRDEFDASLTVRQAANRCLQDAHAE